jgi:DNA modification methylase
MVAFALRADGWYLRQEIIWHKPNCRYESVHDRPTTAHEHVFLLSKSERYRYDAAAIEEPAAEYERRRRQLEAKRGLNSTYRIKRDVPHGQNPPGRTSAGRSAAARQKLAAKGTRNARSVWSIPLTPSKVEHMAMFPRALAERCILAGCPDGGIVLDPFFGAGTTGLAAVQLGRRYLGIDLNPEYCRIARARISAARPIRPIRQIGPTHD